MTDRSTAAEQRAYRALTDIIRDLAASPRAYSTPESTAGAILMMATERGYSLHAAPHTTAVPPRTLADVVDRLMTMSGPATDAASRTVEVDRKELRELAAAIAYRAQDSWPYSGDLIDHTELDSTGLAWRALLDVLATTGTAAVIPADVMPTHTLLMVVAGFTLHPDISPYTYPGTHTTPSVLLTVERRPLPYGCVAVNDRRIPAVCRGPADHQVRYHNPDGEPVDTLQPVCAAHAVATVEHFNTDATPMTAGPIQPAPDE